MRVPQWVYAGAASAAAVVLAVLVSADAIGLLEPGTRQVAREIAVEAEMARASAEHATPIQKSVEVPAVSVEAEQEVSLQAAVTAPQETAAQAAPEAAMAPKAAMAQETPSPMPAVRPGRDDEAAKSPPPTAVSSAPVPSEADLSTAEPGPGPAPPGKPGGTATVWRVVEGIAAALGLAFLGGLLLHRRSRRGARPG